MAECEICGSESSGRAEIDGVVLNVCGRCAELGKKVAEPVRARKKTVERELPESSKYIDPDYPKIIKESRESRGMKIEELANSIKEKESVISRLERGQLSPSLRLARKLENFLEIKLILEYSKRPLSENRRGDRALTIGDIVDLGEDID